VVWLDDAGKAALYGNDGSPKPEIKKLLDAGIAVLGADLLFQGEYLKDGRAPVQNRLVANPREFAGYTYGYNHPVFAQRTHDVLTLLKFAQGQGGPAPARPLAVSVSGFGLAGPIVAAARALARDAIDRAALDTGGFRFSRLLDYRDMNFLPGGAKFGDLPGMLALGAPGRLWLSGEGTAAPEPAQKIYRLAGGRITAVAAVNRTAAAEWLIAE
jgi:hypothetical protein